MAWWQSCSQAMGDELRRSRRCQSLTPALSHIELKLLLYYRRKCQQVVITFWLVLLFVSHLAWMTTTAWSRCAMGVMKGRCDGGRLGALASSCPPWRMSGGAFPCRSSTALPSSAIPISVSGLSFSSSRASWVTSFLYRHVCQQNKITWCCFYLSTGMRWRALINQVELLTRQCWAFIIWLILSWMEPVFSRTQPPMIPSLW